MGKVVCPTFAAVRHFIEKYLLVRTVRHILGLATAICCFCPIARAEETTDATALRERVAESKTRGDSIEHLYNLFDGGTSKDKLEAGHTLLRLASESGDQEILTDMLPQMAVIERKDEEAMARLSEMTALITDTVRRKGVKLFIDVEKASYDVMTLTDTERDKQIVLYAQDDMTPWDNVFDEVENLYHLVLLLGQAPKGPMYLEYLTRLEKLIEQLPEHSRYIRNLYYTTAANAHTRNGNPAKAVEADRATVKLIGELEKRYSTMNRPYRDYSRNYYLCYRRMLRNYSALSPEEVNELYGKIIGLATQNPDLADDLYRKGLPTVYKLMAEKNYAQAIPAIKKGLPYAVDEANKRELLGMLVTAATATDDKATLLPALQEYNKVLEEKLDQGSEAAYHELQMRYDVSKLKSENAHLEIERRDAEIEGRQRIITGALGALLLMSIVLMLLYRSHYRLRRHVAELTHENEMLNKHVSEMLDDGSPQGTVSMREYRPHREEEGENGEIRNKK